MNKRKKYAMSVNINSTNNIVGGNTWSHDDICDKAYQKKGG